MDKKEKITENDIAWGNLNKESIHHASEGNFGLYRNTRFEMAEFLAKEKRYKDALEMYLEVCYLDLNGPNNSTKLGNPAFDATMGFLAPGVIKRIVMSAKRVNFTMTQIQNLFINRNIRIYKAMKLPLTPEDCWKNVHKALAQVKDTS